MGSSLDNTEILHLAIRASADGNHEQALSLLKDGTTHYPEDDKLHHMLGAEYAEIGLLERAQASLQTAIELNPDAPTARFQLALAFILDGDDAAAEPQLTWLSDNTDAPLKCYAQALTALNQQALEQGLILLDEGLEADTADTPLYNDMMKLRAQVAAHVTPDADEDTPDPQLSTLIASGYNTYE